MNDRPPAAPPPSRRGITGDPKVFNRQHRSQSAADVAGIAVLQTLSPAYEQVMKYKPFANPMIKAAIAAGDLGIADASAFDLSGRRCRSSIRISPSHG